MYIRIIAILMGLIASGLLIYLGFEWIYVGFGLNPWIAFPLAFVFYYWPHHLLLKEAEAIGCRYMDLLETIEQIEQSYKESPPA